MKIKICGLCREEEIAAVNEVQPDYIGFVFAQGSRRYVDPRQAALLRQGLSKKIAQRGCLQMRRWSRFCSWYTKR